MSEQNANSNEIPSFEKALEALQASVRKLESGDLPLEQALKQFEEGVKLTRSCQEYLSQAEKKVEILTRVTPEGTPQTESFKE